MVSGTRIWCCSPAGAEAFLSNVPRDMKNIAAREVDAYVITAAFFGPSDKCGLDAGGAEVAGDVVDRDTDAGSGWKPPPLVVIDAYNVAGLTWCP
jgi:hypothetical protein